ncbi:MAG: LysM peptidoglycan-binding domain-containing protein [Chloroflexota bacterium]
MEGSSQYYYTQAEKMLEQQSPEAALDVVQEGLMHVVSSDLLLLAAILSERLGKFDLMRHSVSQIPLNDVLRDEGEWLLRAHQARQRAQRQGQDPSQAILEQLPAAPQVAELPPNVGSLVVPEPKPASNSTRIAAAVASLFIIGLIGAGWFYSNELGALVSALGGDQNTATVATATPPANDSTDHSVENANGVAPNVPLTSEEQNNADATEADSPSLSSPTSTPAQTPTTPALPQENLIEQSPEQVPSDEGIPSDVADSSGEEPRITIELEPIPSSATENATPVVVDADPSNVAGLSRVRPYDILAELRNAGYTTLATLPIDGQLEDDTLVVVGQARSYEERRQLIDALLTLPDISRVNDLALVFRVPDSYIVQEGDMLWVIAERLYGNAARWREIYELNRADLASPEALQAGQILQVNPK